MPKKIQVKIRGKTKEDVFILGDIFPLVDSLGIPLDFICEELKKESYMPDWTEYKKSAKRAGWTERTIRGNMKDAILENYGRNFWQIIEEKLF